MKIPILNLYYLISYASDVIAPKNDMVAATVEEGYSLADLYGRLLTNGIDGLLKRGLFRHYVAHEEEIAGLRGRLLFAPSLKRNTFRHGKAVCSFDELDADIPANQILKAALRRLTGVEGLDSKVRKDLRTTLQKMHHITDIDLSARAFRKLSIHRNMARYRFLLFLSRLVMEHSIVTADGTSVQFIDLERDEDKLAKLFEAFVRNFYRREQSAYKIAWRNLVWSFAIEEGMEALPGMETDIPLESESHICIIDTKYYARAMVEKRFGGRSYRSGNMYQMFAYMEHYPNDNHKPLTGILLYPKTTHAIDATYPSNRNGLHTLRFCTVDLLQPWSAIREALLRLLE